VEFYRAFYSNYVRGFKKPLNCSLHTIFSFINLLDLGPATICISSTLSEFARRDAVSVYFPMFRESVLRRFGLFCSVQGICTALFRFILQCSGNLYSAVSVYFAMFRVSVLRCLGIYKLHFQSRARCILRL
jgi:hypothetical protein